jgi:predicted lipoprotein with Yx(FWY)xxD motif
MGRSRLAAAAAPLILILAACSSAATPTPSAASPSAVTASVVPSAAPSAAGGAASPTASAETSETYELKVAQGSGSIGSYITGEDGKTLYIFMNDTKDSGKSVCNGDCASTWPPLVVESLDEVKADSGVTGTLALVTRDDGAKQVSYKGMPLYYFAADKAAGDTGGQGIGGVWFVAAP